MFNLTSQIWFKIQNKVIPKDGIGVQSTLKFRQASSRFVSIYHILRHWDVKRLLALTPQDGG